GGSPHPTGLSQALTTGSTWRLPSGPRQADRWSGRIRQSGRFRENPRPRKSHVGVNHTLSLLTPPVGVRPLLRIPSSFHPAGRSMMVRAFGARVHRNRASHKARVPRLESLETRNLLATFMVTNANDSGAGSLAQAILDANSKAVVGGVPNEIDFAI